MLKFFGALLVFVMAFSASAAGRPFRLGYFNVNPAWEWQKPLAALEQGGWTINSGILVGPVDQRWIGGFSLGTKKIQWWFGSDSDLTSPPGSFGGSVVLGFRDGRIVKLDALSGRLLWSANLDALTERPFLLNSGTLYTVTATQHLYALDFETGKTLWLFDGGFPDGLQVRGAARPIIQDGKVIYGLASGELVSVAADTGKLLWRFNPFYSESRFHDVVGEMVVRNGHLIVTRYDGLLASIDVSKATPNLAWKEQLTGIATSRFHDGRIYLGSTNGDVSAYDLESGKRIFRTPGDSAVMTLAASESVIYVGGANGRVNALNSLTGELLWYDSLGNPIASSPVIYERAIYFMTGLKSIYAYQLPQPSQNIQVNR